jgi:hypothetical protein
MDDVKLKVFELEFKKNYFSEKLTYILWMFLGFLGLHRFYLKDYLEGCITLVITAMIFASVILQLDRGHGAVITLLAIMLQAVILFTDFFLLRNAIKFKNLSLENRILNAILEVDPL